MTHPADKIYRFATAAQWASGTIRGLAVSGATAGKPTPALPGDLVAELVDGSDAADRDALLARDPAGRLVWLRRSGAVIRSGPDAVVEVGQVAANLAAVASRFVLGQEVAWLLTDAGLIALDAHRFGTLNNPVAAGWRPVAAVAGLCDSVLAVEVPKGEAGGDARLARYGPEGRVRKVIPLGCSVINVTAATDTGFSTVVLLDRGTKGGWRILRVALSGSGEVSIADFRSTDEDMPTGAITILEPGRIVLATGKPCAGVTGVFDNQLELRRIPAARRPIARISDLTLSCEGLFAATPRGLYKLVESTRRGQAMTGSFVTPVLRSPVGTRSGWMRADLTAELPDSASLTITTAAVETTGQVETFATRLATDPEKTLDSPAWNTGSASRHTGDPARSTTVCRHYLGDIEAEYLWLRVDVTAPAGSAAVRLRSVEILYPNRSLIEDLPAIYRRNEPSNRLLRRILAPFQALNDQLDEKVSRAPTRIAAETAPEPWTEFLLSWFGFADLASLPAQWRRGLLRKMPDLLRLRGTRAALEIILTIIAPDGFSIKDAADGPRLWVLPKHTDRAGARLGQETAPVAHDPPAFRLGGAVPLGEVPLGTGCLDLDRLIGGCGTRVVVRIAGDSEVEARLRPYLERIVHHFAPAHTRVDIIFGMPGARTRLDLGPLADGQGALHVLDDGKARRLGDWTLRGTGAVGVPAPVLNVAKLNETLTLG